MRIMAWKNDVYADLGDYAEGEIEQEEYERINDADRNRFFTEGIVMLWQIRNVYKLIFRIHHVSGGPAPVLHMKIILYPMRKQIKLIIPKYRNYQRMLRDSYFDKSVSINLLETCPQAFRLPARNPASES